MLFYFKIGLRNLCKNRRRSIKTMLTLVIGLSACLLMQGFTSHTLWGLKESLISGGLGHVQIYQKGYLEHSHEEPYRYLMTNSTGILHNIKSLPMAKLYAPRLSFQGIISSGEKSTIFMGIAGLPEQEKVLNSFSTLKEGSFLTEDNPWGVVIGSGVARKLNVGVGDTVTLMSTLKDGGINAIDLEITGIIEAQIKEYNDVVVLADLGTIQSFLDIANSIDRMIILLKSTQKMETFEPIISKACNQMGLEYRNWRQLAGKQYTQPKLFFDLIYLLMMVIIVMVVIFSITNTMNLAMQERIREIGTLRSIGTTRLQIGKIFIAESIWMGLIGGLMGIIVGYSLAAIFNFFGGIPIPPPPGQARGYTALFKPDFVQALGLWLIFLGTATVAGFYPAFRAARLQIVDALRWI